MTSRIAALRKRYLLHGSFSSHALTLFTGTTVSRIVTILTAPIITRIYSPSDFGLFSLYFSVFAVLSTVSTGRYEIAILLPENDEDAVNIFAVSLLAAAVTSFVMLTIALFCNTELATMLGNPAISGWLYLAPLMLLLSALYQGMTYWLNRKKQYRRLALSDITQNLVDVGSKLGLGFIHFSANGLILATLAGLSTSTAILARLIYRNDFCMLKSLEFSKIRHFIVRYRRFPLFTAPYSLISSFSNEFIIFALSSFQHAEAVGFFGLALRFVVMPVTFLSASLGRVYVQEAATSFGTDRLEALTMKIMLKIADFCTAGFVFVMFWSPEIFGFFFGNSWIEAGEYGMVLIPLAFCLLFTSWPERIYEVAQKQNISLLIQIFYDVIKVSVVWTMLLAGVAPFLCVVVFVGISCAFHATYLYGLFRAARFRLRGITEIFMHILLSGGPIAIVLLLINSVISASALRFATGLVVTSIWYVYLVSKHLRGTP